MCFCAERSCCCSERKQRRKWVSWKDNARSCRQSSSRFLKTSRRLVVEHMQLNNTHPTMTAELLVLHCFFIDNWSTEFVNQSQNMVSSLEKSLHDLLTEHDTLKVQQQKVRIQWNCSVCVCVCVVSVRKIFDQTIIAVSFVNCSC